jgi:hypothetical protein
MIHYSETARCTRWGAQFGARRVSFVSAADRAAMDAGAQLRMRDCPPVKGETERVIIRTNGRFYARMP